MKFIDYKCNDCEAISEYYLKGDNSEEIKCTICGSRDMIRVFNPVSSRSSSSSNDFSSPGSSSGGHCSGGSCSSCSGC